MVVVLSCNCYWNYQNFELKCIQENPDNANKTPWVLVFSLVSCKWLVDIKQYFYTQLSWLELGIGTKPKWKRIRAAVMYSFMMIIVKKSAWCKSLKPIWKVVALTFLYQKIKSSNYFNQNRSVEIWSEKYQL